MELPVHIREIRQQLLIDEISWSEALNSLKAANTKKPWHSKEWKLERDQLIKDSCAQCGDSDTDSTMVLQHLWQPDKIKNVFAGIKGACVQANADAKQRYIDDRREKSVKLNSIVPGDRVCCPKCESTSIKLLKGPKEWKCYGTKSRKTSSGYNRKVTCGNTFKNATTRKELTPEQKREISQIKQDIWRKACDKYDTNLTDVRELYGKDVVLKSIADSERYYSLKDTTTFCKKCAYLMDVKKLLLCPNCKDYLPALHILGCVPNSSDVIGFNLLMTDFLAN